MWADKEVKRERPWEQPECPASALFLSFQQAVRETDLVSQHLLRGNSKNSPFVGWLLIHLNWSQFDEFGVVDIYSGVNLAENRNIWGL
jgi:hypothetical protein